jgi:hypothetical protein
MDAKFIKAHAPITDNFEAYSDGDLAGQGNWVACRNRIDVVTSTTKVVVSNSSGSLESCVKRTESLGNNQYAKLKLKALSSDLAPIGPAVRCSGSGASSNYYGVYCNDQYTQVFVVVNETFYQITIDDNYLISVNDILELRVSGTTLTILKNGSVLTGLGPADSPATGNNGVYTDTRLSSGTAGICGGDSGGGNYGDDFECGNL